MTVSQLRQLCSNDVETITTDEKIKHVFDELEKVMVHWITDDQVIGGPYFGGEHKRLVEWKARDELRVCTWFGIIPLFLIM